MDTKHHDQPEGERAFTRMELCGVLAAIALLAIVVLPALGTGRTRSDRVICANNLRQVGTAFLLWANDHADELPFEVTVAEGGTRQHSFAQNTWLHFSWISNELRSPKVLFCPSDTGKAARDFTFDPSGGYLHPNFANRATSYFVSHASISTPIAPLAGDRNVRREGLLSGCSRFITGISVMKRPILSEAGWTTGLHDFEGNLLLFDGSVHQADSPRFQQMVMEAGSVDDRGVHIVLPR